MVQYRSGWPSVKVGAEGDGSAGGAAGIASQWCVCGNSVRMNDPEREPDELLASSTWLRRFVGTLVARDDADDLAQATQLAALQAPAPAATEWRRWLAGIGRNLARMLHRSRARSQRALARLPRGGESPSAVDLVQGLEVQRAVSEAMLALPEPTRTILVLRYQHDLPPAAIALRVGLQEPAVRQRLHRGREEVRVRLQQRFGADWRGSFAVLAFVGQQAVRRGATAMLLAGVAALAIVVAGTFLLAATSLPAVAPLASVDARQSIDDSALAADDRVAREPAVGTLGRERAVTNQDRPLRGQVVDEAGKPIAGASIGCIFDYERFVTSDLVAAPAARTDEAGVFTLPRPAAYEWPVGLSISAPGRGTMVTSAAYLELGPIVLPRMRRLAGRVRDTEGRPIVGARVLVRDWLTHCPFVRGTGMERSFSLPEGCATVLSGADGRFVVDAAHETSLYAEVAAAGYLTQQHGPLDSSQPFDFELRVPTTITFEVKDAEGRPVPAAEVEVHRTGPDYPRSAVGGITGADGTCKLPRLPGAFWVQASAPHGGGSMSRHVDRLGDREVLVLDAAPGKAPAAKPEAAPAGAVTLRGRFVDPTRKTPVVGGRVWLAPDAKQPPFHDMRWHDSLPGAASVLVATDDEGRFTLAVAPGRYWFGGTENARGEQFHWIGTARNPEPRRLEVVAGEEPKELVVELQPRFELTGRVDVTGLPEPSFLRFVPDNGWIESQWSDIAVRPRTPIGDDGRFTAVELQQAKYVVQLLLPRLPRQGWPDKVEVARLDLAPDSELKLDLAAARPAMVRGRVVGDLPLPRLAVVSLAANDERRGLRGSPWYQGPIAPLERDGSFVLREPPGRRCLMVVDLRTGVMLHREAMRDVAPGSSQEFELKPEVHRCELRFESEEPLETMELTIRVDAKHSPAGYGLMDGDLTPYVTHVAPDHDGLLLLLPPGRALLELVQHPRYKTEHVAARIEVEGTAGGKSTDKLSTR